MIYLFTFLSSFLIGGVLQYVIPMFENGEIMTGNFFIFVIIIFTWSRVCIWISHRKEEKQ